MLPNWLYGKSKSKLAELLGGGGTPSDYNQVKAQVTQNTENIASLDDVLDTKAALTQISNPNLLDNSWFTVNQRGQSSYSVDGAYFVDRFKSLGAPTIAINNGITITANANGNGFQQRFESDFIDNLLGKTVTLSIMLSDGTIKSKTQELPSSKPSSLTEYATILIQTGATIALFIGGSGNQFLQFYIANSGTSISIRAVKLELGSVSTLAMDAAPNYATELAKCQRYFTRYLVSSGRQKPIGFGLASSETDIRCTMVLPCAMRTTPTIAISDVTKLRLTGNAQNLTPSALVVAIIENNIINLNATVSGATINQVYLLCVSATDEYINFSADL